METTASKTIALGILSFVTTNVDDFLLLLLLFSTQRVKIAPIVTGQFLGILLLVIISDFIGLVGSQIIPPSHIKLLGVLPVLLGILEFTREKRALNPSSELHNRSLLISTTILTLSGGVDNIAVYVPLFIRHSLVQKTILLSTFLVMTGIWCYLAFLSARSGFISGPMNYIGKRAYPLGLLALGVYILFFQ